MRVTNKMISQQVLFNLSKSTTRYLDIQTQSSSQKRINRPSDDPLGITKDLSYRTRLANIAQFGFNVTHAKSWLTFSDQALSDANKLILEAKDLAVQLGNDTYDESARTAGATQVRELFNQIMDAANSQYQGKYIFGGSITNRAPMMANGIGVQYMGDYQDLLTETEKDSFLKINSFASEFATRQVNILGENADLNPGLQPTLWLSHLNAGNGINMGAGQIVVNTLNGSYNVDIGTANPTNIQQFLDVMNAAGIPNMTTSIADSGSGFQLQDTSAHQLTVNTPLSMLNKGNGIQTIPGTFRIRTSDNLLVADIDISAATNLDDVITEINNELVAAGINNVTASIHPTENRLVITDSNLASLNLVIEETGGGTTAEDLGIVGEMVGQMVGEDLNPMHIMVTEFAAGETLAADLGLLQNSEFEKLLGLDVNPELAYNTLLSSLNSNGGIDMGVIRVISGHDAVNLDLTTLANDPNATVLDLVDMFNRSGLDIKAFINDGNTGIKVTSDHDDRSFMIIEGDGGGRTATALGLFGAGDLLGNMIVLEKALENNNTDQIEATLDVFDKALDKLLTTRSSVGSREIRATTSETRLLSQELLVTEQLSQVEDADMLKLATELATAEIIMRSAMQSAAAVMQPTLMDFLR